jgi:hypothetical protein
MGPFLALTLLVLIANIVITSCAQYDVEVYHLIHNPLWGEVDGTALEGKFNCPGSGSCRFVSTDPKGVLPQDLMKNLVAKYNKNMEAALTSQRPLSVGLYSIHSWAPVSPPQHYPNKCSLKTDINIAESEESWTRFRHLFEKSFRGYDGNSTTHPRSGPLQRSYVSEFKQEEFLEIVPFPDKVKGSSYVASTCHGSRRKLPLREVLVTKLESRLRVDSLGKCHQTEATTKNPGASRLGSGKTAQENLELKRKAISRYLFHFAFENSVEPGYVTEKVFDALKAGTVPVYLGPKRDCKLLVPFDKAVVYVEDFYEGASGIEEVAQRLSRHLHALAQNRTAYEEHLQWREHFSPASVTSPLLTATWPCRVCAWSQAFASRRGIKPGDGEKRKSREGC